MLAFGKYEVRPPIENEGVGGITPGDKFHRLTAISFYGTIVEKRIKLWMWKCDCGKEVVKRAEQVKFGTVRSCGCLHIDNTIARSTVHGMAHSPEYQVWAGMIRRCSNPSAQHYERYGGRGIKVCERWRDSFENFLEDMGPRPGDNYSLDRKDNDGHYIKDNCRWATREQQYRNRSSNVKLMYHGEVKTLKDAADAIGIRGTWLRALLLRGYTIEEIEEGLKTKAKFSEWPRRKYLSPEDVFLPYSPDA